MEPIVLRMLGRQCQLLWQLERIERWDFVWVVFNRNKREVDIAYIKLLSIQVRSLVVVVFFDPCLSGRWVAYIRVVSTSLVSSEPSRFNEPELYSEPRGNFEKKWACSRITDLVECGICVRRKRGIGEEEEETRQM